MKNKAYVNVGAVAMGIAGSFCDASVLQKYFGIRAEWVDEVEILRRISVGIYDKEELLLVYMIKTNMKKHISG